MGLEPNIAGHWPEIAPTAYVHPTAILIGRVQIGDHAFVGPQAVIRADEPGPDGNVEPIVIMESTNVQDCVIIHALGGTRVVVGPKTSIAHAAVIHGPCEIGARCFVGFGSIVFHSALADGVIVMHHSLVEHAELAAGRFVPSMTAVRCNEDAAQLHCAPGDAVAFAEKVVSTNEFLTRNAMRTRGNTLQRACHVEPVGRVGPSSRRLRLV